METPAKYKTMSKGELAEKAARDDAAKKRARDEERKAEDDFAESAARTVTNLGYSVVTGVLYTAVPGAERFGGTPVGLDEVAGVAGAGVAFFTDGIASGIGSGLFQAGAAHGGRKLGRALGEALFGS